MPADLVGSLTSLIERWRDRELKLCRKADAQGQTMYANQLGEKAQTIGDLADELEALLRSFPHQQKEEDPTRGASVPGVGHGDLPHRNSGVLRATAPEEKS